MRKPEVNGLPPFEAISALTAFKRSRQQIVESRAVLFERIGTGCVVFDATNLNTLPNAIRIAEVKLHVAHSAQRALDRVEQVDQEIATFITEDTVDPLIAEVKMEGRKLEDIEQQMREGLLSQEEGDAIINEFFHFAYPIYKKAVTLRPNDAMIWNNLGVTSATFESLQQRRSYFEKATEVNPNIAEAWFNLGATFVNAQVPSEFEPRSAEQVIGYWEQFLSVTKTHPGRVQELDKKYVNKELRRLKRLIKHTFPLR